MRKLKRQIKYETKIRAEQASLAPQQSVTVSMGFRGASISDMLSKKAQTICEKNHRFGACKKCTGCRTPNCGVCTNCSDMTAFGGSGTNKQKCKKRVCINPLMRSCDKSQWNTAALCI